MVFATFPDPFDAGYESFFGANQFLLPPTVQ